MASVQFSLYTCSSYSPSHSDPGRDGDGAFKAPPKILFGFELDHTHSWSQVSQVGLCVNSTAVTILDVVY